MTTFPTGDAPAPAHPVRFLLVEDSPSDATMTRIALREGRIANTLHLVGDGQKAMEFLRRQGEYQDAPRPDLIILDLNLPRMTGSEVLSEVKTDVDLQMIPVVILTTSSSEADILSAYRLRANAYVTKPVGADAFLQAVRGIEDFWVTVVRLPPT